MMEQVQSNEMKTFYCCVTCGTPTAELSHQYKEGVIKIIHCKQCQNPVDPYIELDDLLVFIDFVLLKIRAHRHVLFNIEKIQSSHILKLSCALILTNAYIRWFHLKNDQFQSILNHDHRIFYALEYGFYGNLIESLLEYTFRFGLIAVVALFYSRSTWTKDKSILLFRALALSSIGQLFVLPLLIWSPDHRDYYGLFICSLFTILCHSQALNASRLLPLTISFLCSTMAVLLSKLFVSFFPQDFFA